MADEKRCFIIMPITTPGNMVDKYLDGEEHFQHVLDCLFIPSVRKAGFKPITPKAKGADLIHAEIINKLETSDLVLCDISCLNPNVFFEFGIRTSLNKPICVVKDEFTEKVPFDTGIINHLDYQSSLKSWHITAEIEKLAKHIIDSALGSDNENTLWKYFGMKFAAKAYSGDSGPEAKIDFLSNQIEVFGRKMDAIASERTGTHSKTIFKNIFSNNMLKEIIHQYTSDVEVEIINTSIDRESKSCFIQYIGYLPELQMNAIQAFINNNFNYQSFFHEDHIDPPDWDDQGYNRE